MSWNALVPVLFGVVLVLVGCDGRPGGDQSEPPGSDNATQSAAENAVGEGAAEPGDSRDVDCSGTEGADFPDVVGVDLEAVGDGEFGVAVTLCSAYDTPERYADAWRVRTRDGRVLGVRELLHDHAGEQPFTRSLSGTIEVPEGVDILVVEGRDLANGWGGATVEVDVPDS